MTIGISAIICTRNRSQYLREAVDSLVRQSLPVTDYEVVIVDNGSTDDTADVIRDGYLGYRNLRYIHERRIGLSIARNTGWQNARGEYVAYLDDDAVASEDWLANIIHCFETVHPRPACVSGEIRLIWGQTRPVWVSDGMLPLLGLVQWPSDAHWIHGNEYVAGGNMALRQDILNKLRGFSLSTGRKDGRLLSNEDVLIDRRIRQIGEQSYYDPRVVIGHHVLPHRLNPGWFWARYYWQGVSDALMDIELTKPGYLEGVRRGLTAGRKALSFRGCVALLLGPWKRGKNVLANSGNAWALGQMAGYLRCYR
jgi:glycosyltransferase involved in cell wall biosynthesis